jgi:hypothetical protein
MDMVTVAPPLVAVLVEPAEPAITSPALNARPSNRQGEIKLFKIFIDTPQWD